MSTWEERMSQRAHAREQARWREEAAVRAAQDAAEDARLAEQQRDEFEAGPPDGCRECYFWSDWYPLGPRVYSWWHVTIGQPPHECRCTCHGGEPYGCAPVVIG